MSFISESSHMTESSNHTESDQPMNVMGLNVWDISPKALIRWMVDRPNDLPVACVNYINPHAWNLARKNRDFRNILNSSDKAWCDGQGIAWAARKLGTPIRNRWTWPDHTDTFFESCAERGKRLYFIGETKEDLAEFVKVLKIKHPNLSIAGHCHGFFDLQGEGPSPVLKSLRDCTPDIILLGMGMPKQELFSEILRNELTGGVVLSVGALFRYYAGLSERCPPVFARHGFEWLYRLGRHPLKYFNRYIIGNARFVAALYRQKYQDKPEDASHERRMPTPSNYHKVLKNFEQLPEYWKGPLVYVDDLMDVGTNHFILRKWRIFVRHCKFLRTLYQTGTKDVFVRDFSNIPMALTMLLYRRKHKRIFLLNNHNLQWALLWPINRMAFRYLGSKNLRFVFFEETPLDILKILNIRCDKPYSIPLPLESVSLKINEKNTKDGLIAGIIGAWQNGREKNEIIRDLQINKKVIKILVGTTQTRNIIITDTTKVEIIDTKSDEAYDHAIRQCDFLLIHYTKNLYEYRASGIISDAIARNVAVIAPDYPIIKKQINHPCPVGYVWKNNIDIIKAIFEIEKNIEFFDFNKHKEYRQWDMVLKNFVDQTEVKRDSN